MSKKEMITNGEDVSLNEGEIIVLNGVSVAEKNELEKKEPKAEQPVETEQATLEPEKKEEEPIPTEVSSEPAEEAAPWETPAQIPISVPEETPEIPTTPIDLTGIITPESGHAEEDSTIYPTISPDLTSASSSMFNGISDQNPFNGGNGQSYTTDVVNQDYSVVGTHDTSSLFNSSQYNNSFDEIANGVNLEKVKSTIVNKEDLEKLKQATKEGQNEIIDQAFDTLRESIELNQKADELFKLVYDGNQSGALYTEIMKWRASYRGLQQSEDQNDFSKSSYKDQSVTQFNGFSNNFGDDQMNNGGMGMVA